jgi:uncharacterized protein (TIGR02246 family)
MRRRQIVTGIGALGLTALARPALAAGASAPAGPTRPLCDHHQHLLSPTAAARDAHAPLAPVEPPAEIAQLLRAYEAHWNDKAGMAPLYAEDAVLLNYDSRTWIKGRAEVVDYIAERFARPYRITPVSVRADADQATLAGYFTRGEGAAAKAFGELHIAMARGADGAWRITAEMPNFIAPASTEPLDADRLIGMLDEAGIRRAVVLSLAYWYGSPHDPPTPNEAEQVAAENDWTAAQCERYAGRLTAFCSVNPLKDYAVEEVLRCAASGRFRGLKLHFGNSGVDAKKPENVARVRKLFEACNAHRLSVVAHLWTRDRGYGAPEARSFLDNLLPAAPDVTVQIAHMAGGGPGWTDPALEVFADAVAARDPRTRNLYFDLATVADRQSWAELKLLAGRIRQIGLQRILYGSDGAFGGNSPPRLEWATFRGTVPLSDAEFKQIAGNLAPYLR